MKNYKTPEIEMMRIAEIGDVITQSFTDKGLLGAIGENEDEDAVAWKNQAN